MCSSDCRRLPLSYGSLLLILLDSIPEVSEDSVPEWHAGASEDCDPEWHSGVSEDSISQWHSRASEVDFTGLGYPYQKYLRGRSGGLGTAAGILVKFTF